MKVITKSTYGGMDWHDCNIQDELLKNSDGGYAITDVEEAIAKDIFKDANEMETTAYSIETGKASACRLENIPEYEAFLDAVKTGKVLKVTSTSEKYKVGEDETFDIYEMGMTVLRGKTGGVRVNTEMAHGQFNYYTDYIVEEIPDENVRYIPVENFLAPWKGVPSVQRFYQEPFRSLEEARKALEAMELHESEDHVVKEMHIVDIEKVKGLDWYKMNVSEFGKPFSLETFHPNYILSKEIERQNAGAV